MERKVVDFYDKKCQRNNTKSIILKVQKVSFLPKELEDWVLNQRQPVEVKNFKENTE